MSDLGLPARGLTVLHERAIPTDSTSKELPQLLRLTLVEDITRDILKNIRNNEQVRLKLGKKPTVHYGKKQLSLTHTTDLFPSELVSGALDGSKPIYFTGKLSHALEVQQAKQDTAGSDEALANLENTLKSRKELQASNETTLMRGKSEARKEGKPTPLGSKDRLLGTTAPSSPYLGAGVSPRIGPTSNSLLSAVPSKEKIRQDAMRIPMVHLLATCPMKPKHVAEKLNVTQSECEKILEKIARDGTGGEKVLKEKCYRELDVWKFPYPNQGDRQLAIDRAIHAYDRMRIEKHDQLWQLLLPKDERGKGKFLSRLNFDKQPPPATTSKTGVDGDGKAEASDKEGKTKKVKNGTESKDSTHKKKPSADSSAKKKVEKPVTKTNTQNVKVDGKFKSSERIEDSDEEVKGVEVAPAKTSTSKTKEPNMKVTQRQKEAPSAQSSNQQHKSKLSSSSTTSNESEKKRSLEDNTKLKPRPKVERTTSGSRISPRPRTDSSPQKPSPLGSSPPTNSTDLENSSKSSVHSSAPSSPPSSTDMPLSQARKNYSPVIAGKKREVSSSTQPAKRKAEKLGEPPAKRHQIHGLGLPKGLTEHLQQPTPERRSPASSLSSPEKTRATKEDVILAGRDFKTYYAKYKDLHIKLSHVKPADRSDKKLDELWKMHSRLEEMKSDLWADWVKAGGEV